MTDDEYAELADHVIDNSGTPDELKEKVDALIVSQLHERGIRI
jgi:dephospho-CoA kinase